MHVLYMYASIVASLICAWHRQLESIHIMRGIIVYYAMGFPHSSSQRCMCFFCLSHSVWSEFIRILEDSERESVCVFRVGYKSD